MTTASFPLSLVSSRTKVVRLIVGTLAAGLVVFVVVLATRPSADSRLAASPLVGKPVPEVAGATLEGTSFDIASLKGRWVVVNFFASWCAPCQQEHPEIKAFADEHKSPGGPAVLAVEFDKSDVASARDFFARQGGGWPVIVSNGDQIAVNFGVRGLPESFIVNPQGVVTARVAGGVTAEALDRLMQNP